MLQLGAFCLLEEEHLRVQHQFDCNKLETAMNLLAVEADGRAKSKSPHSRRITLVPLAHTKLKKKKKLQHRKLMKGTQTNSYLLV